MAALDTDTIRVRLAIGLFTGSLVPLLIAVPIVLALRDSTGEVADSTRQAAFGVTLLLSIAAAFAGWLLAHQLVVPLSRLGIGVERIAAGERPVTLTSGAPREIEELAVAVQSMASEARRAGRPGGADAGSPATCTTRSPRPCSRRR